jgi:transposase-like protein
MAKSLFSAPHFHNEDAAFAYVEARLWPDGPTCPHCGNVDQARIGRLTGKSSRPGLRKCYACRKTFTVRVGSIFEDSHFPLHLWLQAIQMICGSKKGVSTRQIQRTFDCSMKTAWFLMHRIREMMAPVVNGPIGGAGKTVEADDMEMGRSKKTRRHPEGRKANVKVLSLVERGGPIRSMVIDHRGIGGLFYKHFDRQSRLVTDSAPVFKHTGAASHGAVDHSKYEWARDDVHTNTLEGFFSIFKRGMIGIYQHVETKHFARYLAEFDFRQNTRERLGIDDAQRAEIAIVGAKGKRLTYETTRGAEAQAAPARTSAIGV